MLCREVVGPTQLLQCRTRGSACVCVCTRIMHVCVCMRAPVCMHIFAHMYGMHMYAYTHMHLCACMWKCLYICNSPIGRLAPSPKSQSAGKGARVMLASLARAHTNHPSAQGHLQGCPAAGASLVHQLWGQDGVAPHANPILGDHPGWGPWAAGPSHMLGTLWHLLWGCGAGRCDSCGLGALITAPALSGCCQGLPSLQ